MDKTIAFNLQISVNIKLLILKQLGHANKETMLDNMIEA